MSNLPPHSQPPFPSSILSPLHHHGGPIMPVFSSVHDQKAGFLVLFALLEHDSSENSQACVTGGTVDVIVQLVR